MGGSYQLPLYAGDPPEVGFVDLFEIILIILRSWSFLKHLRRLKSSSSCSTSFVVFQFQVVVNSLRTDSCVNVLASFRRRKMVGFYSHGAFMSCHCITLKFMSYIYCSEIIRYWTFQEKCNISPFSPSTHKLSLHVNF